MQSLSFFGSGQGRIINCFLGQAPNTPIASMFNLSKEHASVIEHISFKRVHELAFGDQAQAPVEIKEDEAKTEDMQVENNAEEDVTEELQQAQGKFPHQWKGTISFYGIDLTSRLTEGQDKNNTAAKESKQKETEEHLFEGADSLIIATTRVDVKSLLQATYPFLVPGQPFSIYSPYIEVRYHDYYIIMTNRYII